MGLIAASADDEFPRLRVGLASGMAVNDVDKTAFISASKPTYDEFGKSVLITHHNVERTLEVNLFVELGRNLIAGMPPHRGVRAGGGGE